MKKIGKYALITLAITTVVSLYMMTQRIGLIDGLQFGCGQYYYTDIPNWQHYFQTDHYQSPVSMLFLITVFFIWGYLMMKLWFWLDHKWNA